jgi:hypothetical protein
MPNRLEQRSFGRLFEEAKSIFTAILGAELKLRHSRDDLVLLGYRLGRVLTQMKAEIGKGNWLTWLEGHWPELGERNARRCMALFRDNPQIEPSAESADALTDESVRKFMWGYIPAKERPLLPGDEKDTPGPHHLTFVNQFAKYDRQLRSGHVDQFSLGVFQREIQPMIWRLIELCGPEWFEQILQEFKSRQLTS